MMNREIYQYELPWNALQLNSEDIYLSMGVGYVPDEEMLKQLDLLKKEIAVRCRPRCLYAFFEASPATKNHIGIGGVELHTGAVITPYLLDADRYVLFIATARTGVRTVPA